MASSDPKKSIPKAHSFVSRNLVTIVMVPAIIGMHYGWMLLQENKTLVPEEDKIELPVITAAKNVWQKIQSISSQSEPSPK